jgi:hypothetical protein
MGGLTEAVFVIAIESALSVSAVEQALSVSAVNHVVKVLNHNEFSFWRLFAFRMSLGSSRSK